MSILFNGATDGLKLNNGSPVTEAQNIAAGTMTAWIRMAAIPPLRGRIIDFTTGVNTGQSRFQVSVEPTQVLSALARALDADTGSGNVLAASGTIALGVWTHVAVVIDYTNRLMIFYVNGVLQSASVLTNVTAGNTSNTASLLGTIGVRGNAAAEFFAGLIEDVRFYSRVLGGNEVLTIYTARGSDAINTGLRGRWQLADLSTGAVVRTPDLVAVADGFPLSAPVYSGDSVTTRRRARMGSGKSKRA
jgi:hypothetical protein